MNYKEKIEEINIITIGIEKVPKGYVNPAWYKPKLNPVVLSRAFEDGLDMTSGETTFIKLEYPLEHFAVGKEQRSFYIRTKDKDAFVELLNGWIDKTVKERLEQAQRDAVMGFVEYAKKQHDWELLNHYVGVRNAIDKLAEHYFNQTKEVKEHQTLQGEEDVWSI